MQALTALSGVVVGFVLKALFDLLMDARRNRREDRVRFHADKLQAYADFVVCLQKVSSLREDAEAADRRRKAVQKRLDQELKRPDLNDFAATPAGQRLREEAEEALAERERFEARIEETIAETTRVTATISLIAPRVVSDAAVVASQRAAAHRRKFNQEKYEAALDRYISLASKDIGNRDGW